MHLPQPVHVCVNYNIEFAGSVAIATLGYDVSSVALAFLRLFIERLCQKCSAN